MSKYLVTLGEENIVFINKDNKPESFTLSEKMSGDDAIKAIDKENKARVNASAGALSLLNEMLKNPRFDGYKGKCDVNAHVPAELKAAIRDIETEFLKPLFIHAMKLTTAKPETVEQAYQAYAKELRTGSYAQAKSVVTRYFAVCGKLPETESGKILPVRAIMRILENLEKAETVNEGIAGKLVKLSSEVGARTEKTELGDYVTALAALKSMLATYEGLHREALEKLTATIGNVDISAVSDAHIRQANLSAREAFLEAEFAAGHISENQFVSHMADIGIDVQIAEAA